MRVKVDFRSASKQNYRKFRKEYRDIKVSYTDWANIIYSYNEAFRTHLLETGEKAKLPAGLGIFAIKKKKRVTKCTDGYGKVHITLPVDWKKTREKGKLIYNFNYHTDGYYFGWAWFIDTATFKHARVWSFKAARSTARLLAHYINVDSEYKDKYCEWEGRVR
jgi:hypothetical protein